MPTEPSAGPLWVFAYGSLMWDPGFAFDHCAPAVLKGYRRAFCVLSKSHRGTPERPGLVLGLAPGGTCRGMVYRVTPERKAEVQAYLFERERRQRSRGSAAGLHVPHPLRSEGRSGRRRIRFPVSAESALHSAGATGGTAVSPTPAGGASLGTIYT